MSNQKRLCDRCGHIGTVDDVAAYVAGQGEPSEFFCNDAVACRVRRDEDQRRRAAQPGYVKSASTDQTSDDVLPTTMERLAIYRRIESERAAQDARYGGPEVDDRNPPTDWIAFILQQARECLGPGTSFRRSEYDLQKETTHFSYVERILNVAIEWVKSYGRLAAVGGSNYRDRLVKIAALAVAAIESHDRTRPRNR